MKTRAITAFFFTLVMLGSVFLGPYAFTFFYLLLSLLALREFYTLVNTAGIKAHVGIGLAISAAVFLITASSYFWNLDSRYFVLLIPLLFCVFLVTLYQHQESPFTSIAYTFVGLIYVTLPFCFFYALGFAFSDQGFNFHLPLSFLLMLWASDTGAYLFGRKLGKTKLFERHSPKKSWEGFFGGVFTSVLVAYLISLLFTELSAPVLMGMAVLVVSFGTLGDLVESMLKRSLNVKDSGTLLPGHGGLLDRFDGLLIGAPIVFAYLYLLLK
ncbi:phosphatidate cytidylyltransferase [Pedobacter sp. CAN_A7]|uniref:phosphatidate cytidylyltransferase n=1 Tax=Pedobacter sp. CAN_A7 TaxID=2787722 RepID=UPI0018C967EC